jgi:hypothetical protein
VLDAPTQLLRTDEVHVVTVVIEKVMNDLTADESHQREAEVQQALFDELGRRQTLEGFRRTSRATSANVSDSRQVLKYSGGHSMPMWDNRFWKDGDLSKSGT